MTKLLQLLPNKDLHAARTNRLATPLDNRECHLEQV